MIEFLWPNLFADVVLISALVFGVYYRRHRKWHMLMPYLGINIGVFAVGRALLDADVGIGVGIGLFGVLSIIRLRSDEISHADVAYYFSSLAIGLVCAIPLGSPWTGPLLGALVLVVMAVVEQPVWHRRHKHEQIVLDRIYPREELTERLRDLLDADQILRVEITLTDLVRDSQTVDVTYRTAARSRDRGRHGDLQPVRH